MAEPRFQSINTSLFNDGDLVRWDESQQLFVPVEDSNLPNQFQTPVEQGITVSTADGNSLSNITELRLPPGDLDLVSPGVAQWTPSAGGTEDA